MDSVSCEIQICFRPFVACLIFVVSFVFPRFLNTVKSAGGDPEVVIRLTTFHDLNVSC